jgi:hypothetical protein
MNGFAVEIKTFTVCVYNWCANIKYSIVTQRFNDDLKADAIQVATT